MSKPQRDRLILKCLIGAVLAIGLSYGLGAPFIGRVFDAQDRLKQIEAKIADAETLLRSEESVRRRLEEKRKALLDQLQSQTPPAANSLLWATEVVYRHARAAGVVVESLSEIRADTPAWVTPPKPAARMDAGTPEEGAAQERKARSAPARRFAPYAVQFNLLCNYDQLKVLVHSLETENPFLTLTSIAVVGRETSPEQHQVRIIVEWPRLVETLQPRLTAIQEMP